MFGLGHWNFEFGYYLKFGYWDLGLKAYYGGSESLQPDWIIFNLAVSLKPSLHILTNHLT